MNDLISRQAAIDKINEVMADYIPLLIGRQEEIPLRVASEIVKLPPASMPFRNNDGASMAGKQMVSGCNPRVPEKFCSRMDATAGTVQGGE